MGEELNPTHVKSTKKLRKINDKLKLVKMLCYNEKRNFHSWDGIRTEPLSRSSPPPAHDGNYTERVLL
jgi:hypothetical protein